MNTRHTESLESRRLFAAGDPLDSFGRHGFAATPYELYEARLGDVKPTPDGKLLASVLYQNLLDTRPGVKADFVRYNADGSPDTTFGGIGAVDSFFGTVHRITVRSDGKFYALGSDRTSPAAVNGGDNWFVARFHPSGKIDLSFGVRGRIALQLPRTLDEAPYDLGSGNRSSFLDTDGRVTLLAAYKPKATSVTTEPAVFRFNASGFLDRSFNDGNPLRLRSDVQRFVAPAMAVASDGGIALAATRYFRQRQSSVVLKLDNKGKADRGFGSDGLVTLPTLTLGNATVAVADDGHVFTGGTQYRDENGAFTYIGKVFKFTANGAVDTTFDGGGLSFRGVAGPLLPTADGGVISSAATLQRFRADGSLDDDFGVVYTGADMDTVIGDAVYGVRTSADYAVNSRGKPVYRYGLTAISLDDDGPAPVTLSNGVATLTGTGSADGMDITIWNGTKTRPEKTIDLRRDWWTRTLSLPSVAKVVMNGNGGNDDLRAFKEEAPDLVVVINGGSGDDNAAGYGTNITFYGGPGNDGAYGDAVLKD